MRDTASRPIPQRRRNPMAPCHPPRQEAMLSWLLSFRQRKTPAREAIPPSTAILPMAQGKQAGRHRTLVHHLAGRVAHTLPSNRTAAACSLRHHMVNR